MKMEDETMADYMEYSGHILIPFYPVKPQFFAKGEVSLDALHMEILKCIEEGMTVEEIVSQSRLSADYVEKGLVYMEQQCLIYNNNGRIYFSEWLNRMPLILNYVGRLNEENKSIAINLVTGDLELYVPEDNFEYDESDIVIEQQIAIDAIPKLNLKEKMKFWKEHMESFAGMSEDEFDKISSDIEVDYQPLEGDVVYIRKKINKIPCLVGDGELVSRDGEQLVYGQGSAVRFHFRMGSKLVDQYGGYIPVLYRMENFAPELVSDLVEKVLEEDELCREFNTKSVPCLYDCVSGKYRYENLVLRDTLKSQFLMKDNYPYTENMKEQILKDAREHWEISGDMSIEITSIVRRFYKVGIALEDLCI